MVHFSSLNKDSESEKKSFIERNWGIDSNTAGPNFKNRWLMVLPAFFTHMCIGSPYAWSMMGDQVTRELGFVASAPADWTLL